MVIGVIDILRSDSDRAYKSDIIFLWEDRIDLSLSNGDSSIPSVCATTVENDMLICS